MIIIQTHWNCLHFAILVMTDYCEDEECGALHVMVGVSFLFWSIKIIW
jgi:hypothetical protein